jgi:hypothetical protein
MPRQVAAIGSNNLCRFASTEPGHWAGGILVVMESGIVYRATLRRDRVARLEQPVTAEKIIAFLSREDILLDKVYSGFPLSSQLEALKEEQVRARIAAWLEEISEHEEPAHLRS